jgi:uncharacterized membrane protein
MSDSRDVEGGPAVVDVIDELQALKAEVEDPEQRERVQEVMRLAAEVQPRGLGNVIVGFDRADVAEAFLGALLFGIPMFVEGGTQEVGAFVAANPLFLLGTVGAANVMVAGILYVADFQDVRISNPILGVVPRRFAGVLTISFLTALGAMTAWGRVDWATPWLSLCTVAVAFVPMAIGAALGDILPGT